MPIALERTAVGKLAAYAASPVAGISSAFATGDWAHNGAGSLSLASGALRYTSGSGDTDVVIRELASDGSVANRAAVQVLLTGAVGGTSLDGGPALRVSADTGAGRDFLVCRGGSLGTSNFGLQEVVNGSTVQSDVAAELTWTLPERVTIAVDGATARGQIFVPDRAYSLSGLTVPGTFAGWVRQGGSSGSTRTMGEYFRCRSEVLRVEDLPDGYTVQVRSGSGVLLASAVSSAGVAELDLIEVDWSALRQLRVLDGSSAEVALLTPADGVWPGDVYALVTAAVAFSLGVTMTPGAPSTFALNEPALRADDPRFWRRREAQTPESFSSAPLASLANESFETLSGEPLVTL